jgi:FkbM family methyltransferase
MKGIINFGSLWRRSLKAMGRYNQWLIWQEKNFPTRKMKKMRDLYSSFIHNGSLCFDIGANTGTRVASFLMLRAKVVAVEPQRICYEELQKNFKNEAVTVVPKGVGAKNEIRDFYLADNSLISSFSTDWIKGQKTGYFKNNNWDRIEKVEIVTLDMLIERFGLPDFIKIDTEGFELEVLKGLSKPVKALSFEYTLPHQKDKAIECIGILDNLYKGKALYNICRDEAYEMKFHEWISAAEIIQLVEGNTFNIENFGLYGDVYAKALN